PGVVIQNATRAEPLHVSQLAAEIEHKAEANIDIIVRLGQSGTEDEYPAVHRRGDEQLFLETVHPGTGFGIMQSQGSLNGEQVLAFDGQPTARTGQLEGGTSDGRFHRLVERNAIFGTRTANEQHHHGRPDAERKAGQQQQHRRDSFLDGHPLSIYARSTTVQMGSFPRAPNSRLHGEPPLRFTGWKLVSTSRFTLPLVPRLMARIGLTLCWLASVALGAAPVGPGKAFELQANERVVLLGDTLIEREQLYGFVEQWFTTQSPERRAIFRNLGWSADTPAALSRASFDFEKPEKGFQRLKDQLVALQPTLVVLGYGMANSFSGEAGLAQFKTEMNRLVDTVRSCTTNGSVRFIVLSPLPHEDLGRPLPDPAAHNRQLELYTRAL